MATVYIETSIIGYLTARSASDVVFQARQLLTRQWWDDRRKSYDLLVSQLVIDEVSAGDEAAAQERLDLVDGIPLLDAFQPAVEVLSNLLIDKHLFAIESENGRPACGSGHGFRCRLSVDLELPAYRQCGAASAHILKASRGRIRTAVGRNP